MRRRAQGHVAPNLILATALQRLGKQTAVAAPAEPEARQGA
jgi:hypothetical protein